MQSIEKAIQYLNLQKNKTLSNAGIQEQMPGSSFFVKSGRTMHQINYDDLLYIEGQQEYVSFHTAQKTIIAYYSLKKLEEELPSGQFIRIHKSYIISIKHIETIASNYIVISGKKIPIGKHYTDSEKFS
jgi:DNA-binding LytR/AlgR family response regulator